MNRRPPESGAGLRLATTAGGGPRLGNTGAGGLRLATTAAIVLAGAALLTIALAAHPVGDYHAESDFYGGYAEGARQIERGHVDPTRYPVVGPVYELALALLGFTGIDLFLLAKLLSVAAACAVLASMAALMRRRFAESSHGALTGLWLVALLAVNPTFVRYGYSATNDMLSLALASGALLLLLDRGGGRRLAGAGVLAALASLTRYSEAILLPAGVLALAIWPPKAASRPGAIMRFAGGFALIALPWTLYSMAHHAVPGEPLLRYFSFYANPEANRSVQDLSPALPDSMRVPSSPITS